MLLKTLLFLLPLNAWSTASTCPASSTNQKELTDICEVARKCNVDAPKTCDEPIAACWPKTSGRPASKISPILMNLTGRSREDAIETALREGSFPESFKKFRKIEVKNPNSDFSIELNVAPDYVALGTDSDFLRIPMQKGTAQILADSWGMILPTSKMVDAIYFAADQKLSAAPLEASSKMSTTEYYVRSQEKIQAQTKNASYGEFLAGHKKDVILGAPKGLLSIYGWAGKERGPGRMPYIQPDAQGGRHPHDREWVDYSHGIRMISQWVQVRSNGSCRVVNLRDALKDPKLCSALSYHCPAKDSDLFADQK